MERSPSVSTPTLASLTLAAVLLAGSTAEAATHVSSPSDGTCRVSAEIRQWSAGDGPPARFIAETFARGPKTAWIGLGHTKEGFWSAESGAANDACDSCDSLDLVLTRFDGSRRTFPVITTADANRLSAEPPEALRDLALKRLWHYAARDWPVRDMKQDYALRLPPSRGADGVSDPFPGWMAEVSKRGTWLLRFSQKATPFMCWCHFEWRGWALAAPRAK